MTSSVAVPDQIIIIANLQVQWVRMTKYLEKMKNILPAGDKCDFFKNSANGRIMEQFCDDLKDRTVFSGSLKV